MSTEKNELVQDAIAELQAALAANAEFYHAAAINSEHEAIASLLRRRTQERREMAQQLAADGDTEEPVGQEGSGLLSGLRRGLLTITAAMTIGPNNTDKRVLEETQAADARLMDRYRSTLARDELPDSFRARVNAQYEQIQATYAYTGTRLGRQSESVVLGLFERKEDLEAVAAMLRAGGIDARQIAIVTNSQVAEELLGDRKVDLAASSAGVAAIGGTVLGGFLGLLAGIGAVMLPGIGALLAVSATTTAIAAAAAGAGIGAAQASFFGLLIGWGVAEQDTHRYTRGIEQGELMVVVHVPAERAASVAETLRSRNASDVSVRADEQLSD